jgi:hypothetical protein
LLTACNAKAIFQPLALDDNRVYSFTPILAGGRKATEICPADSGRQNVSQAIEEVWFSGAHADVGGTYEAGAMLDGELASVSLNWVLERLQSARCDGCSEVLALPKDLKVREERLTSIHDGKRTSIAYSKLFRQSRKPLVYWNLAYGAGKPIAVHASVIDRLEWLFALDKITPGCGGTKAPGEPVICAEEIASHGLVPELLKKQCLKVGDWGYRLIEDPTCVDMVGERSHEQMSGLGDCDQSGTKAPFTGMVYRGELKEAVASLDEQKFIDRDEYKIPFPRCLGGETHPAPRSIRENRLPHRSGSSSSEKK